MLILFCLAFTTALEFRRLYFIFLFSIYLLHISLSLSCSDRVHLPMNFPRAVIGNEPILDNISIFQFRVG